VATHFAHDELLPRASASLAPGALLALLAHAALLVALTATVQWRTKSKPDVISAELWASVPQVAAPPAATAPVSAKPVPPQPPQPPPVVTPPPPPSPPPTPKVVSPPPPPAVKPTPAAKPEPAPEPNTRDADIATEQARRAKELAKEKELERSKADAERKASEAKQKRDAEAKAKRDADIKKATEDSRKRQDDERKALEEAKAEDDKLAKQREENLRRIMGQAANTGPTNPATGAAVGTGGSGNAAVNAAPSAAYVGRLIALIRPNIVFTGQVAGNPAAEVEVRTAPGGSIMSRRLAKSSGVKEWDDAVLRAIDRTAALPRDTDGRVPPELILVFRPKD
jgi:colicin import membrane protein